MKILTDKNKRIIGYAIVGYLKDGIEVENLKFEHPINDYIFENGKIKYSPKPIDKEKLKKQYFNNINTIKEKVLENGFTWKEHQQKWRLKDIILIESVKSELQKQSIKYKTKIGEKWSFNDSDNQTILYAEDLEELKSYGMLFTKKVYAVERILKTQEPHIITFEKYLEMVKELK